MKLTKQKRIVVLCVMTFVLCAVAVYAARSVQPSTQQTPDPSDQEIRAAFDCDRVTADFKESDIFCTPELYRNPNLSAEKFYVRMSCDERLANPPSTKTREIDQAYTSAYDTCADKVLFEQKRAQFNSNLQKLKAENPLN
jgi:hypothetical protein